MPPNQQCQSTEGTRYPLTSNTLTCLVTKAHVCEVQSFPEDCLWVWRGLEYLGKHCQLTMVCVGLSPDLQTMEQIRRIMRPTDVPDQGLLCDLLWSDPDKETMGWGENDRGVSFTFGAEVVAKFLHKHDLDLICRAHQVCVLLIAYDVRPVVVIRHTVHRCGLLLQMYVVWSVYLCWSQPWAVLKWLSRSRCCLGCGLGWAQEKVKMACYCWWQHLLEWIYTVLHTVKPENHHYGRKT